MAVFSVVKCSACQPLIDRFFEDFDAACLQQVRGHVGGCSSCRARYCALYMTETMIGSRSIPASAAELLDDQDKERAVNTVSPSQKLPTQTHLNEGSPPGGIWISGVLGAVAIALVVLLVQTPAPKRQQKLASIRSQEALALDLYCVERESKRFLIAPDGTCDAPLEIEFRNRGSQSLYLSMIALIEGEDTNRVVTIVQNLKLPPTKGTALSLIHEAHDQLRTMKRRIIALVSSSEKSHEETLAHIKSVSTGTRHHRTLVRTWFLRPGGS
jgi:hypothetical protein